MIYHSGSTFGYRAYLTLLPAMNVGVVTLMTGSDYQYKLRTALHMTLMDHALSHAPWINTTTICSFPDPWRSSAPRKKRSTHARDLDEEMGITGEEEEEEAPLMEQPQARANRVKRAASLPASNYVGIYRHAAYGTLEVRYNSVIQSLELEYGIGLWRLESTSGHDFDGVWKNPPPTINKNFRFKARGSDVYAVMGIGFEPSVPPVFYR